MPRKTPVEPLSNGVYGGKWCELWGIMPKLDCQRGWLLYNTAFFGICQPF